VARRSRCSTASISRSRKARSSQSSGPPAAARRPCSGCSRGSIARAKARSASEAEARARDLLARVGLAARVDHYPAQLSGGEQQRLGIARAFAPRPRLLFADEPTGNLDRETGRAVANLLFDLNREEGTTLVIVTHDLELAQRAGRIVQLDAGRVTRVETPAAAS